MATTLYSFVGLCAKKLQEIITEEAILLLGVEEELAELLRRIRIIQCSLDDAERRRAEDSAANRWLGQLRDAMYDVDYIIDLARSEGTKILSDCPSSSRKSATCNGLSVLSCFSNIRARHEVAVRITSLNKKIENISKDKIFLTFEKMQPAGQGSTPKLKKSSNLVEPNLVGKEIIHSSRKLVDLVLTHKENKAYKLGIVGTGGVGKTTLAQKIYNDQRIKGNFKKHAWICVSQEYNEITILKEVLRNIGMHQQQGETIAELQSKLAETIADKNFFLVLDDAWQSNVWTDLLRTPLHAATAGVILVTTRDDTVAMKIGVGHTHRVDLMSVDVGWELLWKIMNITEEKEVQYLKNIGIEIVRKCGYLPLAIKVTASVLACRDQTENEWQKILRKYTQSQSKLPNEIEGALYLSYDELPHHLKQCFLYCALYPEDSTIHRDDLVRLWVAEGFVKVQHGQLLEDTAEEYYYELIHRNLLQPNGSYFDHTECKMHDLLRQLACYLSREECFIGDPESLKGTDMSKLRRVTVVTKKDIVVLPSMGKGKLLVRTFQTDQEPRIVEDTIFKRFPYLHVLELSDSLVQSIPDYIGNLIHLCLLDLDGTGISCLPESIGSLKNLQILSLQRCSALHHLPLALTQLCSLRRLGFEDTPVNHVPKGIGRLEFLNDLEDFPIGGGNDNAAVQDGWELEELGHLSQLRRLYMIKLERAAPPSTNSWWLRDKKYLKFLSLRCTECIGESYPEEDICNIEKTFEQLIPTQNLEDLGIDGFFGRRYPTWLGTNYLSSLKHLRLLDCEFLVHLPPIGQLPNLKYLKIDGATAVAKIGLEFVGGRESDPRSMGLGFFPKLESLVIKNMPNWEEWSFIEDEDESTCAKQAREDVAAEIRKVGLLPRLNKLELVSCPKLRALPGHLGEEATSLKRLQLRRMSSLEVVENLGFLFETLVITGCEGLTRVSNLSGVRELRSHACPNLRCVRKLDSLQQLWLSDDMREISSFWLPGLRQQHQQLHDEDLDVYTWA